MSEIRYVRYWRNGDPPSIEGRTLFEFDAVERWLTAKEIRDRGLTNLVCECEGADWGIARFANALGLGPELRAQRAKLLGHEPGDGILRQYTVRGYERDSDRLTCSLEPPVSGQYALCDEDHALEIFRAAKAERPELHWVIEWRVL